MNATPAALDSAELDLPVPEPHSAKRNGPTELAQALEPWLKRMMHRHWGRRVAAPHYRRSPR